MTKELSLAQLTLRNLELRLAEGNQTETDLIEEAYKVEDPEADSVTFDTSLLNLCSEQQVTHAMGVRKDGLNHWRNTNQRMAAQRPSGTFESCAKVAEGKKRLTSENSYVDANLRRRALDDNENNFNLGNR